MPGKNSGAARSGFSWTVMPPELLPDPTLAPWDRDHGLHLSRRTWFFTAVIASLAITLPRLPRPSWWIIALFSPVWIGLLVFGVVVGNVVIAWLQDAVDGIESQSARSVRRKRRRRNAVKGSRPFNSPDGKVIEPPGRVHGIQQTMRAHELPEKIASLLSTVLDLVTSTFILPWYTRISASPTFPEQIQHLILDVILNFSGRIVATEDLSQVLVRRIVPRLTRHFTEFRKIEHLLESATNPTIPKSMMSKSGSNAGPMVSEVDPSAILQSHFPSLHHALPPSSLSNPTPTIHSHLRLIADRLLPIILPLTSGSDPLLRTFIRELLVGKVLGVLVETLSEPDVLNRLLEEQADKYQVRRNEVSQVRAALEHASAMDGAEGAGRATGRGGNLRTPKGKRRSAEPEGVTARNSAATDDRTRLPDSPLVTAVNRQNTISDETSTKDFEKFLRSISKLRGINDAKRMRMDVERAQRKTEQEIHKLDAVLVGPGGKQEELEDDRRRKAAHLERLQVARRKADSKVRSLNGGVRDDPSTGLRVNARDGISLRMILQDPAAVSFFMEYMDRRKRSRSVQFWIAVETFKNPLEVIESSDDEDEDEMTLGGHVSQLWDLAAIRTAQEDLARIWQEYLIPGDSALEVETRFTAGIRKAIDLAEDAPLHQKRKVLLSARACSVRAQRQIFQRMEDEDFREFRDTELYRQSATIISADLQNVAASGSNATQTEIVSIKSPSGDGLAASRVPSSLFIRPGAPSMQVPRWLSFSNKAAGAKSDGLSAKPPGKPAQSSSPHLLSSSDLEAEAQRATQDLENKRSAMRRLRSWSISRSGSSLPITPGNLKAASTEFLFGSPDESIPKGKSKARNPLFDDETEEESVKNSIAVVARDAGEVDEEDDKFEQIERMEAIQAALTSIIEKDVTRPDWLATHTHRHSNILTDDVSQGSAPSQQADEERDETWPDLLRSSMISETGSRSAVAPFTRPSITPSTAITNLVTATGSTHRVEHDDIDDPALPDLRYEMGDVPLAQPGELELTVEIARMGDRIDDLRDQEATLETMIRTAELTGKQSELTLLQRSQKDLQRELRALGFRRAQYERQEFDNRLVFSQTRITIPTTIDETTEGGRVIRYVVEVQQFTENGDYRHGWTVARRYNDFYELNQELRATPGIGDELRTRSIEMPGKQLVPIFTPAFLEHRRVMLERYLKLLIGVRAGCDSTAVRTFLSRQSLQLGRKQGNRSAFSAMATSSRSPAHNQGNAVKSLYKTMAASLDDMLLGPSLLDVVTEKMTKQAIGVTEVWDASMVQLGNYGVEVGSAYLGPAFATSVIASPEHADRETGRSEGLGESFPPSSGPHFPSTFAGPICDFLVELIGFKDNNWMRKQALVLVVQQLLGSTIERKFRDGVKQALNITAAMRYLDALRETLWPGGKERPPSPERSGEDKLKTKANAARKLQAVVPDIVASMIGKSNSNRATRRLFSVYQIKLLNQHLILTLLDEVLLAIFPEVGPLDTTVPGGY